jgi:hypothetical protein
MRHSTEGAVCRRQFLRLLTGCLTALVSGRMPSRRESRVKAGAPVPLQIVSVSPQRPHLVAPGSITTFVVSVTNSRRVPTAVTLRVTSQSDGWSFGARGADRLFRSVGRKADALTSDLAGGEKLYFVVEMGPERELREGQMGVAEVTATIDGQPSGSVTVRAKVSSSPKIYFAAYDGLGRGYVQLDRQGECECVETDPLTPNMRRFMADSACLLRSRGQVPSLTDSNHVSAITGSWPGTTGVICVRHYYGGRDEQGNPVLVDGDSRILHWGSNGAQVESIFHVAKNPAMGGDPDALNAMILGKEWVGHYFRDLQRTVDVIAGGLSHPDYIPAPEPYVLGDPPSDGDADQDRDGCNLKPDPLFRMIPNPPYGTMGQDPDQAPDDRWVVEGALRIIAAEDPDVFYIQPGSVDLAQHHTGAADRPGEWNHGSHADVLWDDFNCYSCHANRDPVLDIVHEADETFALLVETLQARETYDKSVLILMSDHGQRTYVDEYLGFIQVCLDAGIPEQAFDWVSSGAELAFLWLTDPSFTEAIESALENFSVYHPTWEKEVHPFLVLNRDEMDTGVDSVMGRVAADGGPKRGELYSEWYIDHPVEGDSREIWPDLIVFVTCHYQVAYSDPRTRHVVGGHGGVGWPQNIPLAIRGPGISRRIFDEQAAHLVDIVPTLCSLMGWTAPANVDGRVLSEILPAA